MKNMKLSVGGNKQGELGNQSLAKSGGMENNLGSKGAVNTPVIQAYPAPSGASADRKILGDHGNEVYGNYAK